MDRLWAPWRIEYIRRVDSDEGCFMCKIAGRNEDRKDLVLYRGKESYVLLNKYPYNSCHLMVVPYKHTHDMLSLSKGCLSELLELSAKSMDILKKAVGSQGFNCGMNFGKIAGAGVEDHCHLHVIPRWAGDTNYMPIMSDIRVIPQYLEETYDQLIGEFRKLGGGGK